MTTSETNPEVTECDGTSPEVEMAMSMALMERLDDLRRLGNPPGEDSIESHGRNWVRHDANVRHLVARICIEALRSLPVAKRAAAAGFTRSVSCACTCWRVPSDEGGE